MKQRSLLAGSGLLAAVLTVAGCATGGPQPYENSYPPGSNPPSPYYGSQPQPSYGPAPSNPQYTPYYSSTAPAAYRVGTVERIEVVRKGASHNVAGTVIGGIVGGLIGNQIGSGRGQTAATIAGAAGGAMAGNQIEGRSRAPDETFRVTVRFDDGNYQVFTHDYITDLRTGDRVRIEGDRLYRYQ